MEIKAVGEFNSAYFGTTTHGKPGTISEYVRHIVSIWRYIEINGKEAGHLEFNTGVRFYANDYDLPAAELEVFSHDYIDPRIDFVLTEDIECIDEDSPVTAEEYRLIAEFILNEEHEANKFFATLEFDEIAPF